MANALYTKYKEALIGGTTPNLSSDTIKAVLVDTGTYTVNLGTHQYLSDISGTVGTAQTLGSKSITGGVFDAADVTYSAVSGASVEAIVIYKDTGTPSTSQLIAYIDSATGLPVTPNGGDIIVSWDNGTNKIFKL